MQVNASPSHTQVADVEPERLAKDPRLTSQEKIAEASRQFEGILLRQILDSSTKTVIKSKLADNSTTAGIYHDMITSHLADSISKSGGFGLAQTFEQQLNHPGATGSKAATAGTLSAPATARLHLTAVKPAPLSALHE